MRTCVKSAHATIIIFTHTNTGANMYTLCEKMRVAIFIEGCTYYNDSSDFSLSLLNTEAMQRLYMRSVMP